MNRTKIKICGISTPEALDAAIQARADYIGFVFFPPSPRNLVPEEAARLSCRADRHVKKVGLFVDADDRIISEACNATNLDILQLHGKESPARSAQIKQRFGLPVWKALPVASASDISRSADYQDVADLVLFDAKTPGGALPGGMGLVFDWALLSSHRTKSPWGLAGGLTPDNVAEAIRATGAALVDTSSGVESAPGVKDVDKIAAFCEAARNSR